MNRYPYNLSHLVYQGLKLGHLKPIDWFCVNAGESFDITFRGTIQMAPLRAPISIDPNVHIAAYYTPHRVVYNWQENGLDNEWEKFIEAGYQYNSGGADALDTVTDLSGLTPFKYIPKTPNTGTIPAFLTRGLADIWTWFYRIPNKTFELDSAVGAGFIDYDDIYNPFLDNDWGWKAARLPEMWCTGLSDDMYDATTFAEVPTNTGGTQVSLLDIAAIQGEYQSEIMRDWFDKRYGDLLKGGWGSNGISPDVEKRSELIALREGFLSGFNVTATADSGSRDVGESVGVQESTIELRIPNRYFKEHGTIWIVALVRFPSIYEEHEDYLANRTLTYENFAADPRVIKTSAPIELTRQDFWSGAAANESWGWHPFGQHWRCGVHSIDERIQQLSGWPFISNAMISSVDEDERLYDDGSLSVDYFGDTSHWGSAHAFIQGNMDIRALRIVPPATESIYAGAHLN